MGCSCAPLAFIITRFVRYEEGRGLLKAFCDVSLGEHCLIRGVRVVEGKGGLFVSLPRQLGRNGKWYDSVVLMSPEAKAGLTDAVLRAYHARVYGRSPEDDLPVGISQEETPDEA